MVGSLIGWWQSTGGQLSISHNTPPSWQMHWVHSSSIQVSPSARYWPSLAWHLVGSPGTKGLLPSANKSTCVVTLYASHTERRTLSWHLAKIVLLCFCYPCYSPWFFARNRRAMSITSTRRTTVSLLYDRIVALWNGAGDERTHFVSFVAETFSASIEPGFAVIHVTSIPWHAPPPAGGPQCRDNRRCRDHWLTFKGKQSHNNWPKQNRRCFVGCRNNFFCFCWKSFCSFCVSVCFCFENQKSANNFPWKQWPLHWSTHNKKVF